MVRLFYKALAAMALLGGSSAGQDPCIIKGNFFGGPNGRAFSDITRVNSKTKILSLQGRANRRVDAIGFCYAEEICVQHGGKGGSFMTLPLEPSDKIYKLEAHRIKHHGHTKIAFLRFTYKRDSGDDQTFEFGRPLASDASPDAKEYFTAPKHSQLIGFYGNEGDELDGIGVLWLDNKCAKKQNSNSDDSPD